MKWYWFISNFLKIKCIQPLFLSVLLKNKWLLLISLFHPFSVVYAQWSFFDQSSIFRIKKNQTQKKESLNFQTTLPDVYLDQVIYRKKKILYKCAIQFQKAPKNFLVELMIQPSGKTKSRLIQSEQINKEVLKCSLNILDQIKFKKFNGIPILKRYYFLFQ